MASRGRPAMNCSSSRRARSTADAAGPAGVASLEVAGSMSSNSASTKHRGPAGREPSVIRAVLTAHPGGPSRTGSGVGCCRSGPAGQSRSDDRRPARSALDLESAAEQPQALAHAREADAALAVLGGHERASGSKPWPSSRISMQTPSTASSRSSTETVRLPLCCLMLLSASCRTRRSAIRCDALSASKEPVDARSTSRSPSGDSAL